MSIGVREIFLDDNKKVTIDLRKISIGDFRLATDKDSAVDKSDAVVARACGMKLNELQALSQPDYRRIIAAWWEAATQPLEDHKLLKVSGDQAEKLGVAFGEVVRIVDKDAADPNSPSESTSA